LLDALVIRRKNGFCFDWCIFFFGFGLVTSFVVILTPVAVGSAWAHVGVLIVVVFIIILCMAVILGIKNGCD
jgi:hypothetical protein